MFPGVHHTIRRRETCPFRTTTACANRVWPRSNRTISIVEATARQQRAVAQDIQRRTDKRYASDGWRCLDGQARARIEVELALPVLIVAAVEIEHIRDAARCRVERAASDTLAVKPVVFDETHY